MNLTRKIAAAAVTVLAVGGAGIGTAVASSHAPVRAHPASAEPVGPDTDSLMQGDQTSPDTPGTAASARTAAASHKADGSDEENNGEGEGNGNEDGPGGHADPSGDVQHEFNGVE